MNLPMIHKKSGLPPEPLYSSTQHAKALCLLDFVTSTQPRKPLLFSQPNEEVPQIMRRCCGVDFLSCSMYSGHQLRALYDRPRIKLASRCWSNCSYPLWFCIVKHHAFDPLSCAAIKAHFSSSFQQLTGFLLYVSNCRTSNCNLHSKESQLQLSPDLTLLLSRFDIFFP